LFIYTQRGWLNLKSGSPRYENKRLNVASYSTLIHNVISGFITEGLIDLGVIKTYIKMEGIKLAYFDVLLTVHLSIILLINQLNAQNLVL